MGALADWLVAGPSNFQLNCRLAWPLQLLLYAMAYVASRRCALPSRLHADPHLFARHCDAQGVKQHRTHSLRWQLFRYFLPTLRGQRCTGAARWSPVSQPCIILLPLRKDL
jgi:hypothetical protein